MKRIQGALLLLALAGCDKLAQQPRRQAADKPKAAAPAAPKIIIPVAYRGEWSLDLDSCGDQTDQRLIVGSDRINFYGADAPLTALEHQPDGSVEALAHVTDNTGGYDLINRYALSADGQTLTLTGAADQPPVRLRRCPAQVA